MIAANRERYANLRAFRNTLILVTGLLAVFIVAAAGWHALNPDFLSLCSDKSGCLDGSKTSQGTDVALVALVGFSQQVLTQFVDKRASSLITPDH